MEEVLEEGDNDRESLSFLAGETGRGFGDRDKLGEESLRFFEVEGMGEDVKSGELGICNPCLKR